ncbi:hypothetical protein COO91_03405 [Nostoc flagelliforme CCNUN1]|uniref:Uncharacterized protein n=1 Tax=Nostoc flagelliforme CCNUN1 TaxID=2038116 RepID=A0A2K8SQ40_9NOSO|nr:hypothetical protein [Nostoc flagelliforme]AUB37460.1 hypothetical protein COO91_03405 [Nostoc flagelliforme CCNUN1]
MRGSSRTLRIYSSTVARIAVVQKDAVGESDRSPVASRFLNSFNFLNPRR